MSGAAQVIRLEADQIEARHGRGQFRRRRKLDNSPRGEQLVIAAVARAKEGDADALRYLYLRYADNVYGYVCSIVRDEHEAEDVTQQVLTRLMSSIERYEQRSVPFSSWLLRITHNMSIDHIRARRPVPIEHVHSPDEVAPGGGREALADLRLALDALPAEQRDVIVLRFLVGLTPSEVAERMGRSEDAVHGLQHRGRRRLRSEMRALAA